MVLSDPLSLQTDYTFGAIDTVKERHIPRLTAAMSQIADLLTDPSLYDAITEDNYRKFTTMLEDANREDIQRYVQSLPQLEDSIKLIQGYIKRIEDEMPSKGL